MSSTSTIVCLPDPSTATMPKRHYLNNEHGILSWLLTQDHKRIGILYLITITLFFLVGGVFAGLIRLELLTPMPDLVASDTYNKLFTMHGIIMIFLFLIPSVPATLGNFLIPMMIGAKDLAFPKLNLLSWYLLVLGGCFTLYSLLTGGVDTGWTFTTPLSTHYLNTHVITTATAIFIAGFSSIFTGLNFIVTVHKMRCPGMTWFRLPLFVWATYAASIIMVLATPVLAISLTLVVLERLFGVGIFDPNKGGDPLLFQHLFWFYSHPGIYIMILPGFAVMSEIVSTFSRKRVFGYTAVAFSSVGIATLGFFIWGHHMFIMGLSNYASLVFSLLTMLAAVPSAIKIFNYAATLHEGSITFETPMLYALGFMGLFTIGGLSLSSQSRHGYPPHRNLLRRSPLPLHHGRRHVDGISRWNSFLVAKDDGPHVSRGIVQSSGGTDLCRLQYHFLSAVSARLSGYAAQIPCLSPGVPGTQCHVYRWSHHPWRQLHAAPSLPRLVAQVWSHCRR